MKLFLIVFCPVLSTLSSTVRCEDAPPPAIAVTIEARGETLAAVDSPRIIMAAWLDGRLIWSHDQTKGGAPFLTAQIDPAKILAVLDRFEKEDVFKKDKVRRSWFGPDSSFHSVWLKSGVRHVQVRTWHELFEANPNLVAVNGGITALNGRKREDVIQSDTKEFQTFRKLWTDIRTSTSALIPKAGKPFADPLKLNLPR